MQTKRKFKSCFINTFFEIKMKKLIKSITLFLILIFPSLNLIMPQNSIANPIYIPDVTFSGGLLPKENYSLSLISANVEIVADTSDLKFLGEIHFNGNYTIFNPENDINITIGAPFNFYPIDNCTVLLNGTNIPFTLKNDDELFDEDNCEILQQYMVNRNELPYFRIFWVLCNVSIPKNSSIRLEYKFNTPRPKSTELVKYFYIIYDVGTARLWNGNITEVVEIKVHRNFPTSIFNEDLCNTTNISNEICFRWEWYKERIEVNYVGLHYYVDLSNEYEYLYNSIKFTLILVVSIVGITLLIIKRNYNIKNKKKLFGNNRNEGSRN